MAKPRARKSAITPDKFTDEEMLYLTALFESDTQGLKGVGTAGFIYIAHSALWPNVMAKTYGGTSEEFASSRGKKLYGWRMDVERRLELVKAIEAAGMCRGTNPLDFDKIRGRLEKATSSALYTEDGD